MPVSPNIPPIDTLPWVYNLQAIGTDWRIDTAKQIPDLLMKQILKRIETFDKTYSRFRSDSLLRTVAKNADKHQFPDDALKLVTFYRDIYDATAGAVTPLIGNALEDAGYDSTYSFTSKELSHVPAWDDVIHWHDTMLVTTQPVTLDFGAAGKGYLVDIIAELLLESDHLDFVIDASGDIRHVGSSQNIVGLEHPLNPAKIIGALSVENTSLCASATNRRAWGNGMHHILNPKTLMPVRDIIATWVSANDTMTADGLATALFFVEPAKLQQKYEFEYVRMHANNTVDYSPHLNGELYI
jgi:thiamine biosynthesis lipoprotein